MLDPNLQLERLKNLLLDLQSSRFYGTIEIEIRDGTIQRIVKHESIKLEQRYGTKGS